MNLKRESMSKRILFIFLLSLAIEAVAQEKKVQFYHDHAGNRTFRQIIVIPPTKSDTLTIPDIVKEEIKFNKDFDSVLEQIKVYPNPTESIINVIIPSDYGNSVVTLYNEQGKLVFREDNFRSHSMDLSSNEVGIYYLAIYLKGNMFTYKIIKQ